MSHCVTVSLCHRLTVSPSHCVTVSLCQRFTVSPSHCVTGGLSESHLHHLIVPVSNQFAKNDHWSVGLTTGHFFQIELKIVKVGLESVHGLEINSS